VRHSLTGYRTFLFGSSPRVPSRSEIRRATDATAYLHTLLILGSAAVRMSPHFPVGAFPLLKKITGQEGDRTSDVSQARPSTMASPTCAYTWFNFPHMYTHLIDELALSGPLTHHL